MRWLLPLLLIGYCCGAEKPETTPEPEHHFIDVRKLVKNTIDAMAQLPQTAKQNTTKNPEDLYRLFQIPADIMTDLAVGAGYIDPSQTTTYGPIFKNTPSSNSGPFRQMTEEESREAELATTTETERKEVIASRKEPIILPPKYASASSNSPLSALNLPALGFPQAPAGQPPLLPSLSAGLPTPQYAYQPIVQADGTTLYQQVLILPSSLPFKAPEPANAKEDTTSSVATTTESLTTRTEEPLTTTTGTEELEVEEMVKHDEHKVRKYKKKAKKAKTQAAKTVKAETPLGMSENKEENDENDNLNEKEKLAGLEKELNKHLVNIVEKGDQKLITTILPSSEQQKTRSEVFQEIYTTSNPSEGGMLRRQIVSKSPLKIRSISGFAKKSFARRNPITEGGENDNEVVPEHIYMRKEIRRTMKSRGFTKDTFDLKTITPLPEVASMTTPTTSTEEPTTTETPTQTTTLRQLKRLQIKRKILKPTIDDDEPKPKKRKSIVKRRRIIAKKPMSVEDEKPLDEEEVERELVKLREQDMQTAPFTQASSSVESGSESGDSEVNEDENTTQKPTTPRRKIHRVKKIRRKSKTSAPLTTTTEAPEVEEKARSVEEEEAKKADHPTVPQANVPPVAFRSALKDIEKVQDEEETTTKPMKHTSKKRKLKALENALKKADDKETQVAEQEDEPVHHKKTRRTSTKKHKHHSKVTSVEKSNSAQEEHKESTEAEPVPDVESTTTSRPKRIRHKKRKSRKSKTTVSTTEMPSTTSTTEKPTTTTEERIQITRQHCLNIRSFATQFGIGDPTDFALRHCSFIENYYPQLTCEKTEEYMVYCREYFKNNQ